VPYVARYGPDGALVFVTFGEAPSTHSYANAVSEWGERLVLGGFFFEQLRLGARSLSRPTVAGQRPGRNAFVAVVGPGGEAEALVANEAEYLSGVEDIAVWGDAAYVTGELLGWASFGGVRVGASEGINWYAARLDLQEAMSDKNAADF
jgi:hypothetical protein